MSLNIIVAVGRNMEIGCENRLLWPIREDLKRFKSLTMGHPVIMGRKTWESLPKRPLPGRLNIVVSRNPAYIAEGAEVAPSLEQAIAMTAGEEAFVIGGEAIYSAALPMASKLFLTRIDADSPSADAFFPTVNAEEWRVEECSPAERASIGDEEISYHFETLKRK